MLHVVVVYFSQEGSTHQLATSLCAGIESVTRRIVGDDIVRGRYANTEVLETVDVCEAIVFGSPTYMGGPSAQLKAFADATSDRWDSQQWRGKIAAGFTCGSSPAGDQLATLQYFTLLAAQHGMLWVNLDVIGSGSPDGKNRLGTQLGSTALTSTGSAEASDLATAHHLGKRVAQTVLRMNNSSTSDQKAHSHQP